MKNPSPVDELLMMKNIMQTIKIIGDDPTREGLIGTPKRIVESWKELFSGYDQNSESVFTVFETGGYDQIILLRDCEFYSTCEHHMLPFFGRAHIAYIPKEKVIGISKLARLLEIYSRRLQIQERLGMQIVADLDKYLDPVGSACILEAQHLCMLARGVQKQNSVMITSALTRAFRKEVSARNELMRLIK